MFPLADHGLVNGELNILKREANKRPNQSSSSTVGEHLPQKRRLNAVQFYGAEQTSRGSKKNEQQTTRPKMTEVCVLGHRC